MNPVPILLYHSIANSSSSQSQPFTVTPSRFTRHLDALTERGYRCVTVSEFMALRASDSLGPEARIALVTFDDGYADFTDTALQLLSERKMKSTLYLTTGWLEGHGRRRTAGPDDRMMSWADVPGLPGEGVEVGSHSHRHLHMDTLRPAVAHDELVRSKDLLEAALNAPVLSFAYPHGYNHRPLRRQVRKVGYESAGAVRSGFSHAHDNAFRLARIMIFCDTPTESIERWLDGKDFRLAPRVEHPRTTVDRVKRRSAALVRRRPTTEYA